MCVLCLNYLKFFVLLISTFRFLLATSSLLKNIRILSFSAANAHYLKFSFVFQIFVKFLQKNFLAHCFGFSPFVAFSDFRIIHSAGASEDVYNFFRVKRWRHSGYEKFVPLCLVLIPSFIRFQIEHFNFSRRFAATLIVSSNCVSSDLISK